MQNQYTEFQTREVAVNNLMVLILMLRGTAPPKRDATWCIAAEEYIKPFRDEHHNQMMEIEDAQREIEKLIKRDNDERLRKKRRWRTRGRKGLKAIRTIVRRK